MRLRLNDQAVLCVEFMVEQHPEKHSICPFLCQRYAITGALQLFTTFLQLLQRKGRHKRTRDEWKKFHESRIVRALKPYRAAWGRMKGAKFCSRLWSPKTKKSLRCNNFSPHILQLTTNWQQFRISIRSDVTQDEVLLDPSAKQHLSFEDTFCTNFQKVSFSFCRLQHLSWQIPICRNIFLTFPILQAFQPIH